MIQAIQLILALSFLVLIHELGHFTFARIFHVRVEKFYMFFNPWISILRIKKFDGKWHVKFFAKNEDEEWATHPENTEWGIGWLPFGGYCAIAGMVDETHKTGDLATEPQEWEFRSKPAWQRLLIILGGILVNFIGALVIFTMLFWHWGQDTLPIRNVTTGFYYSEVLRGEGFEQQDKILTVDGVEPGTLTDVVQAIIIEGKRDVTVLRGTDTVALTMSEDLGKRYLAIQNEFDKTEREKKRADDNYAKQRYVLITEWIPFVVDTVLPEMLSPEYRKETVSSPLQVWRLHAPSWSRRNCNAIPAILSPSTISVPANAARRTCSLVTKRRWEWDRKANWIILNWSTPIITFGRLFRPVFNTVGTSSRCMSSSSALSLPKRERSPSVASELSAVCSRRSGVGTCSGT